MKTNQYFLNDFNAIMNVVVVSYMDIFFFFCRFLYNTRRVGVGYSSILSKVGFLEDETVGEKNYDGQVQC